MGQRWRGVACCAPAKSCDRCTVMTTLLIFDTTAAACSVALWRNGAVIADRYEPMPRGQAERLLPMIQEVLDDGRLDYGDLNGVAVTCGPGAFTGLRIGLSAARGLALGGQLPLVGVSTFEALALRADGPCLVAIDTKRRDLYLQAFDQSGRPAGAARIATVDDALREAHAADALIVADNPDVFADACGNSVALPSAVPQSLSGPPRASAFAGLAAARLDAGNTGAAPIYLRAPEARLPDQRRSGAP